MKKISLIALILFIALIGNFTIEGWHWGIADFVITAILLFITMSAIELANKKIKNPRLKFMAVIGIALILIAIWAELAVGAISKIFNNFDKNESYSNSRNLQTEVEERMSVEDYFVEKLMIERESAKKMASEGVIFRPSKSSTLQGIIGNLYYYSFIDNKSGFEKLLNTLEDKTPGNTNSLEFSGQTINLNTSYYLNYEMSDEEIALTLLNDGALEPNFSEYSYLFMPGKN